MEWLKLSDKYLSDESMQWLSDWSWNKNRPNMPSKDIVKELSQFKPLSSVVLYRGVNKKYLDTDKDKPLRSFSYEIGYAGAVAGWMEDKTAQDGVVIKKLTDPKDILVDITMVPNYQDNFTNEVIVTGYSNDEVVLGYSPELFSY
jgi:hypothetical protein